MRQRSTMTATLFDPQGSPNQPLCLASSTGLQSPSIDVAGLPSPKPRWLMGNAGEVKALGLHVAVEKCAAQYGPLFRFQVGP